MATASIKDAPSSIPEGYLAIPLSPDQMSAPLRLCAIVRKQPDPVSGHLVLLRDMLEAKVYMGCVVDSLGRLQQWVEIWVQTVDAMGALAASGREGITNKSLDDRWMKQVESFDRLDPTIIIRTSWET